MNQTKKLNPFVPVPTRLARIPSMLLHLILQARVFIGAPAHAAERRKMPERPSDHPRDARNGLQEDDPVQVFRISSNPTSGVA